MKIRVNTHRSRVIDGCNTTSSGTSSEIPAGTWISQGEWDASTDVLPVLGRNGDFIREGYNWKIINGPAPTLLGPDGGPIVSGGLLVAAKNLPNGDPSDESEWTLIYAQV